MPNPADWVAAWAIAVSIGAACGWFDEPEEPELASGASIWFTCSEGPEEQPARTEGATMQITATEAADALATQVVVAARRAMQHQLDQGKRKDDIRIDGKAMIEEIMSEAAGGHMGGYLQRCAESCAPVTVRRAVKAMTR